MPDTEVTTFIASEAGTIRVLIALNEQVVTAPTEEDPDGTTPDVPGDISNGGWAPRVRP
jgi:hypothetical protein